MSTRSWSPREEDLLRELYPQFSRRQVAAMLNRTEKAVASRAKLLQIRRARNYRPWTEVETEQLRALYPHRATSAIAQMLGRSLTTVYQKADKLGLEKTEEYLDSPAACRLRRGDNVGAAFRFKKGQVPFNKGLRRPGWGPGRMKETQFKRGERRGVAAENHCPIGTIKADPEGYLRIKVRDAAHGEQTGFGNTKVWPLLNRHAWEQAYGPIPARHNVVFKDGNRANCDLSNLELVSRREMMLRNTVHKLPKELAQVIQLRGALNRKIRSLNHAQEQNV